MIKQKNVIRKHKILMNYENQRSLYKTIFNLIYIYLGLNK